MSIPPFIEQKRIADKLEAVLARVDACRERLDRVPAILKRFRQSVLAAATSGKLTEDWREERGVGAKWSTTSIQAVAQIGTGSTPLRSNQTFYSSTGTPWITSAATARPIVMAADEFEIIRDLFAPLADHRFARGLSDDVAVIEQLGPLVVTTDAFVEGVHFLPDDPLDTVAKKALRINFSALIASGRYNPQEAVDSEFSPTEMRMLQLLCEDYDSKAIAEEMSMSLVTVHRYRIRLLEKAGVKNATALVFFAVKDGLVRW